MSRARKTFMAFVAVAVLIVGISLLTRATPISTTTPVKPLPQQSQSEQLTPGKTATLQSQETPTPVSDQISQDHCYKIVGGSFISLWQRESPLTWATDSGGESRDPKAKIPGFYWDVISKEWKPGATLLSCGELKKRGFNAPSSP